MFSLGLKGPLIQPPQFLETTAERRGEERNHAPFQIAIHDREENLQEQIDGINEYRQQV